MRDITPFSRRSVSPATEGRIDPFAAFRQQFDRLFDDFFAPGADFGAGVFTPALDYSETDKEVRLRADLPGVEEKDIEVSINGPILTIKGEKRTEHEEGDENRRVVERSYGAFRRAVRLPFEPKDSEINAKFKNGVLTVNVRKPAELARAPTRIPIARS